MILIGFALLTLTTKQIPRHSSYLECRDIYLLCNLRPTAQ